MKNTAIIILLVLMGSFAVSCQDESELILDEGTLLKDRNALEDIRALNPGSIKKPSTPTNDGERGRDHRDNVDWNDQQGLKAMGVVQQSIGSLYIDGYDEENDEYILKFYWGNPVTEETMSKYNNKNAFLLFRFPSLNIVLLNYNVSWYVYRDNDLHYTQGIENDYHYLKVHDSFYYLGESFYVPRCVLQDCEEIIIQFYSDSTYHFKKEWSQSVEDLLLDEYKK